MGAEGGGQQPGPKRYAAFITYAHDDDADTGYVSDFHDRFQHFLRPHLEPLGVKAEVFFDQKQGGQFGDVKNYFREKASKADFLIILVGDFYPTRPHCLYEWIAFQAQFGDTEAAQRRLCIFEIDPDAIQRLKQSRVGLDNDQNDAIQKRADDIESCFKISLLDPDKRRLISRAGPNNQRSQQFDAAIKTAARNFANHYIEIGKTEARRVAMPDIQSGDVEVDDRVTTVDRPFDTIIGASTPDLTRCVDELDKEMRNLGAVGRINATDLLYLSDKELSEKSQKGRWFVQPFSWHRVLDANRDGGGHIIRQAELFGNFDKTLSGSQRTPLRAMRLANSLSRSSDVVDTNPR
jgi:hypothetical protein